MNRKNEFLFKSDVDFRVAIVNVQKWNGNYNELRHACTQIAIFLSIFMISQDVHAPFFIFLFYYFSSWLVALFVPFLHAKCRAKELSTQFKWKHSMRQYLPIMKSHLIDRRPMSLFYWQLQSNSVIVHCFLCRFVIFFAQLLINFELTVRSNQ